MKHCKSLARLAAGGLLWLIAAGANADYVVLQSYAAGYTVGQVLAGDGGLSLGENERVVLLSDHGDVIEVSGPHDGAPKGAEARDVDIRNALAQLIVNADSMHTTLGSTRASRTGGSAPPHRDAWYLDPFLTGNQCVLDGADTQFWREDTKAALSLLMQQPGREGDGVVDWAAGEATAAWPENLPLVDGELYVLRRPGWLENAMIRIVVLEPGIAASGTATIAWLAINGCREQASILLAALP